MHPLELQVKDLKEQVILKDKKLKTFENTIRSLREQLDEIKEMLHPSRQKHIDALKASMDKSLSA